jgi:hypothetical protein
VIKKDKKGSMSTISFLQSFIIIYVLVVVIAAAVSFLRKPQEKKPFSTLPISPIFFCRVSCCWTGTRDA